jgi:predicted dehydrogenase
VAERPLVAVSGLGSIGLQHVQALSARGDVRIAACDPAEVSRLRAAALPGVEAVHADVERLLELGPEALVVAAPDEVHLEQLLAATERGVTTLVEKPLAPSYASAAPVVELVRSREARTVVGYVLRHRRSLQVARASLLAGAIGEPVSFQVMLGAYGTIVAAVSRFATRAPDRLYRDYSHEWDYLRWIFGPIVRCCAVARTIRSVPHVEEPNAVDALLGFESGLVGSIHLDYAEPRGVRTLHVVGTGGSLLADLQAGTVVVRAVDGDHERAHAHPEPPAAALGRQLDHLLAVARGEEEPLVTLDDGLAALAVTEAVRASAAIEAWTDVAGSGGGAADVAAR